MIPCFQVQSKITIIFIWLLIGFTVVFLTSCSLKQTSPDLHKEAAKAPQDIQENKASAAVEDKMKSNPSYQQYEDSTGMSDISKIPAPSSLPADDPLPKETQKPAAAKAPSASVSKSAPKPAPAPSVASKSAPTPAPLPASKSTSTLAPTPAPPPKSSAPASSLIPGIKTVGSAEQVILVSTSSWSTYKACIETYEKRDGVWKQVFTPMDAVIGHNGMGKKKEGDGKSPIGTYSLGTSFGMTSLPSGVKMPYRQTTLQDYWIDDAASPDYNKWIHYAGDPDSRWKSFERLRINPYRYAVVINYNTSPIVAGKGSAIFLHVWSSSSRGTAGCTAVSESNMVKILKWLNPQKHPRIIQGPTSYLKQLAQ